MGVRAARVLTAGMGGEIAQKLGRLPHQLEAFAVSDFGAVGLGLGGLQGRGDVHSRLSAFRLLAEAGGKAMSEALVDTAQLAPHVPGTARQVGVDWWAGGRDL